MGGVLLVGLGAAPARGARIEPSAGPGPGPWTALIEKTSFSLTAHDRVNMKMFVEITPGGPPFPEPASLALLAMGVTALAAGRLRRGRSR